LAVVELGCVEQEDGGVRGGGAGYHVARVLFVAGGVGDDVFAPRGAEVAVGDVDGDAWFAFGVEAVGQGGEVGGAARGFDLPQLVAEQGFAVVEEAADEGGFTVIDAAGGDEAQGRVLVEVGHGFPGFVGFRTGLYTRERLGCM